MTSPRNRKYITYLVVTYVLSRILYYTFFKVRYDASTLITHVQIIDPRLLQNNLLESLYYLHGQPPLFNLFLGIILKLFPNNYVYAFQAVYLALGVTFFLVLFLLMTRLGVSRALSAVLLTVFMVNPHLILYENWLQYTYPVAVLLSLSAFMLFLYLKTNRKMYGAVFFFVLSIITLTYGLFHLVYFLIIAVLVVFVKRKEAKETASMISMPLLLILLIYLKNLFVFGQFGIGSAYAGLSMATISTSKLPAELRTALVGEGHLSELSLIPASVPRKSSIETFRSLLANHIDTGISILDDEQKSTGSVNFHNIVFYEVSRYYIEDALYSITHYPGYYLDSVRNNIQSYFNPPTHNEPRPKCCSETVSLEKKFNALLYGYYGGSVGWYLVLGLPVLLIFGAYKVYELWEQDPEISSTLGFMIVSIGYLALVTILIAWGSQQKYRIMVESFYLILLGLLVQNLVIKVKLPQAGRL